jgi:oligoribonuclease (3'-5' exoribonuclease)
MNLLANIWNHPKSSLAGVLIAIVTVAGVLSQQGITLGTAGSGTILALLGALATSLLGLLARDPGSVTTSSSAKLGAWALIVLLLLPAPWLTACSGAKVAQQIVNWTPALQSAIATVDSAATLLDPADAAIITTATVSFDAASNLLATQAKAYLANPTANLLAQMQSQVVMLQQQVNSALLQAAKISNPISQQHVLNTINAVATIVSAILALVQSISSKAAVAHMAAQSPIKLAAVLPYLNQDQAARTIAAHYGESLSQARLQVRQFETEAAQAGF